MAPRSPFLAFLRVDDLMYLLIKQFSPAEITNQAASSTLIDWPTHHSTLLSLQLVCRTSRDALRVYFYNRRFCERRIVSHILTGCDEVFTLHCSSDYCEQSPLVLPCVIPLGFSVAWRSWWSENIREVDLSPLCHVRWSTITLADLPLDPTGKLFPNARSLSIQKAWGSPTNKFSQALHLVARSILPSAHLQELTLGAHLSDALPILARASAGSPLVSLLFTSPPVEEPGCSTNERLDIVKSIGLFVTLRVLSIPSVLLHQDTLPIVASLPSLEVLQLTSRLVWYGWRGEPEPEQDDWSLMTPEVGGFARLYHVYFDGTPPGQLVELTCLGLLLPAARMLTYRGPRNESADKFVPAFKSLNLSCKRLQHLDLGLASLDAALLGLLAGLNLTSVNFLPVDSPLDGILEATARNIWPSAEIATRGYNYRSI